MCYFAVKRAGQTQCNERESKDSSKATFVIIT